MRIYCTKWLFTRGIFEAEAEDLGNGMVKMEGVTFGYLHGEGKDWHKTRDSAVKKAEEMRAKKLKTLEKQIKKISAMKF